MERIKERSAVDGLKEEREQSPNATEDCRRREWKKVTGSRVRRYEASLIKISGMAAVCKCHREG